MQSENSQDGELFVKEKAWQILEKLERKSRADAKEAEVVAELKKLLQESVTAAHQTSRRRRRADKKETLPTSWQRNCSR